MNKPLAEMLDQERDIELARLRKENETLRKENERLQQKLDAWQRVTTAIEAVNQAVTWPAELSRA